MGMGGARLREKKNEEEIVIHITLVFNWYATIFACSDRLTANDWKMEK